MSSLSACWWAVVQPHQNRTAKHTPSAEDPHKSMQINVEVCYFNHCCWNYLICHLIGPPLQLLHFRCHGGVGSQLSNAAGGRTGRGMRLFLEQRLYKLSMPQIDSNNWSGTMEKKQHIIKSDPLVQHQNHHLLIARCISEWARIPSIRVGNYISPPT